MADLIQDPASNGEMLKPYEVEVKPVAQTQEQTPAQEQTTTEVQQEPEAEPKPEQESVQASQEVTTTAAKATPVDPTGLTGPPSNSSGALSERHSNSPARYSRCSTITSRPSFLPSPHSSEMRNSLLMPDFPSRSNPTEVLPLAPHFIKNEPKLDVPLPWLRVLERR